MQDSGEIRAVDDKYINDFTQGTALVLDSAPFMVYNHVPSKVV